MLGMAEELAETVGVSQACRSLGVPRSSFYRARQPRAAPPARPTPPRALSAAEKAEVRAELNSERFCDAASWRSTTRCVSDGISDVILS
jgi:putative transposase